MKNLNKNFNRLKFGVTNFDRFKIRSVTGVLLLAITISISGCKKSENADRDYGYAKLTVDCAKKCHVNFFKTSEPTVVNDFDIEASQGIYYIRYKRQYSITFNVTPTDEDQDVRLNVYSREEKQIYKNVSKRKANEVWSSTVIIP